MSSAFDAQQQREVANRGRFWDWPSVRAAVEAARGARECADVESEQSDETLLGALWTGLANAAGVTIKDCTLIESTAGEPTIPPLYDYKRLPFCWFSPRPVKREPLPTLLDQLWEDHER